MKTVSAPSGIGAPVKMRTASPGQSARRAARPAVTRSTTASRVSRVDVEIGVPHRVAVDRRIVERRQVDRRHDILGEHAPDRGGERHGFDLGDRRRRARR